MKIKALQERLNYWHTKYPGLFVERLKNGDRNPFLSIINTIMVADVTPRVSWLDKEVLESFVDELVKPFLMDKKGFKKYVTESNPEILKPVLDLIKRHRDKIIDSEISGMAELNINGIKEVITKDEIIKHGVRTGRLITKRKDVIDLQKNLISYKKHLYGGNISEPDIDESPSSVKVKSELPERLDQIFDCVSKYNTVMGILVEKKFIQPNTYIWKNTNNGYKSLICALMKDFEAKGYLKFDIKMNWLLCKKICCNTFRVKISSNKTYYSASLSNDLKNLIPPASTIG